MSRCNSTKNLEIHHKRRDGGNGIGNAQVLCQKCHENTGSYGVRGESPPEFSEQTKAEALKRAEYRCECEKDGCHDDVEKKKMLQNLLTKRLNGND
ncbi:MAG: hypothetical protein LBG74_00805 [Spirochaetaceae bacterium]|jgi:5-methylcytosine-specific restriction endonuclease McrA|nr:hypothetical protein [Spirochaetaceae bacterium]